MFALRPLARPRVPIRRQFDAAIAARDVGQVELVVVDGRVGIRSGGGLN
jgi:hypothetical protein